MKEILKNFDFQKVHDYMVKENWTYYDSPDVPSVRKLRQLAGEMLRKTVGENCVAIAGGFTADENSLTFKHNGEIIEMYKIGMCNSHELEQLNTYHFFAGPSCIEEFKKRALRIKRATVKVFSFVEWIREDCVFYFPSLVIDSHSKARHFTTQFFDKALDGTELEYAMKQWNGAYSQWESELTEEMREVLIEMGYIIK